MMFDEQPDGNPHGECAAEIHRLEAEITRLRAALNEVVFACRTKIKYERRSKKGAVQQTKPPQQRR